MQALVSGFLAILFLQSGLDKLLDRKGNREYLGGYFAKSPLRRLTGVLFWMITALEILTGVLCAAGCLTVVLFDQRGFAFAGAALAGVTITALFFGQRMAKDYAGSANSS
jgi:hypothetical protein